MKVKNKKKSMKTVFICAICLIICVILIFIIKNKKKQDNTVIEKNISSQVIEQDIEQQENVIKEVNDDIYSMREKKSELEMQLKELRVSVTNNSNNEAVDNSKMEELKNQIKELENQIEIKQKEQNEKVKKVTSLYEQKASVKK